MRKTFVLDTNVLLHDPRAMFHFAENDVVIPIYVLEEIDHFKKELSEKGRNAREVARRLDEFRHNGQSLAEGVVMENGSRLQVALATRALPDQLKSSQSQDNNILGVALEVRDKSRDRPTILVTKDVNLRIRADALGLKAEEYDAEKIDVEELYSGNGEVEVSAAAVDQFY
ncbi:MAG TPA: PIN domain-containing protein, partial [Polyangia bacterium]